MGACGRILIIYLLLLLTTAALQSCSNKNSNKTMKNNFHETFNIAKEEIVETDIKTDISNKEASIARWMGVSSDKKIHPDFFNPDEWIITLYAPDFIINKVEIDKEKDGNITETWVYIDSTIYRQLNNNNELYLLRNSKWILLKTR
jgi:hypothetical protein